MVKKHQTAKLQKLEAGTYACYIIFCFVPLPRKLQIYLFTLDSVTQVHVKPCKTITNHLSMFLRWLLLVLTEVTNDLAKCEIHVTCSDSDLWSPCRSEWWRRQPPARSPRGRFRVVGSVPPQPQHRRPEATRRDLVSTPGLTNGSTPAVAMSTRGIFQSGRPDTL